MMLSPIMADGSSQLETRKFTVHDLRAQLDSTVDR